MKDMNKLREARDNANALFKANALEDIVIITNKVGKTKDGVEYHKELRLTTQDRYNFQIIDDKYSELYYGRLDSAIHKLFKLLSGGKKESLELEAYIESLKDIKPNMVNRNIDINEMMKRLQDG